jgi:hypothetical protein
MSYRVFSEILSFVDKDGTVRNTSNCSNGNWHQRNTSKIVPLREANVLFFFKLMVTVSFQIGIGYNNGQKEKPTGLA